MCFPIFSISLRQFARRSRSCSKRPGRRTIKRGGVANRARETPRRDANAEAAKIAGCYQPLRSIGHVSRTCSPRTR